MKGNNFLLTRIRSLEARLTVAEQIIHTMETRPQLRRKDVAQKFGIAVRSVHRMVQDGRLPKPRIAKCGPLWAPDQLESITL